MIDFNTFLNTAFDAAIEAKIAPIRKQIDELIASGVNTHIVRVNSQGELNFVPDIEKLVDAHVEHGIEAHREEYDHDEFVTKTDIESKVGDKLDGVFRSKFNAALNGTRVTLNT